MSHQTLQEFLSASCHYLFGLEDAAQVAGCACSGAR